MHRGIRVVSILCCGMAAFVGINLPSAPLFWFGMAWVGLEWLRIQFPDPDITEEIRRCSAEAYWSGREDERQIQRGLQ